MWGAASKRALSEVNCFVPALERRLHNARNVCAGHLDSRVTGVRERSGQVAKIIKGKNANRPWTARYWHEGRQRERSFTTRREADDFIAKFEHDRRLNLFVDPRAASETFGEAAQRWIDTSRCHNTRTKYQGILDIHLTGLAGRKLRDVANDRDGVQALTINHSQGKLMLTVIRMTCQSAVNAGRLPSHRLNGLKCNHVTGVRDLIIATPEQINAIANALGDDGLAVHLMRGLGLRAGEVLGLRSTDFMINGMVRVSRQRARTGAIEPLKHRKALADGRDIPLPPYLAAMVREHVAKHGEGNLFTTTYHSLRDRFTRAARKAGLPAGYSMHQLRHAFASALLPQGIALTDVSRWLGHADTRETSRVYAHLMPGQADRARALLEAAYQDPAGDSSVAA
jgi:integrase